MVNLLLGAGFLLQLASIQNVQHFWENFSQSHLQFRIEFDALKISHRQGP